MTIIVISESMVPYYSWKCLRPKYFAKCPKDVSLQNKSLLLLTNLFIIVHCSKQKKFSNF